MEEDLGVNEVVRGVQRRRVQRAPAEAAPEGLPSRRLWENQPFDGRHKPLWGTSKREEAVAQSGNGEQVGNRHSVLGMLMEVLRKTGGGGRL